MLLGFAMVFNVLLGHFGLGVLGTTDLLNNVDDTISHDMVSASAPVDVATDVTVPMDDEEAFDVLDDNGNGAISMRELSMWRSSRVHGPF